MHGGLPELQQSGAALGSFVLNGADCDFVTIPDVPLLFNGDFKRVGDDLKITGAEGKTFLVQDYFKSDRLPVLLGPDGSALTGDVVAALAGPLAPGQFAQAGGATAAAAQAIGRVATVEGSAVAIRNGVAVALNAGDVVLKGDVVQTQAGSKLGIVLTDGTVFNLSANARMVLNEFVYNPAGANNSSLINLVQGSFSFLAGEVAKTGDMKVSTPVATMGIRGTLVQVDITLGIDASGSVVQMSVLVEPNGTTGSFNVYNNAGQLIGTVSQAGTVSMVTAASAAIGVIDSRPMTPAELANALQVVAQVVQTQAVAAAIIAAQTPAGDPSSTTTTVGGTQITTTATDISSTTISVSVTQTPSGTTVTSVTTNTPTDPATPATTPTVVTATATAPVLAAAIADRTVAEDASFNFTLPANTFTDVDSAFLTYSYTATVDGVAVDWVEFDPATLTFSGTPPEDFNGTVQITVTASDGSLTASDTFTLTVTPVNDAPEAVADVGAVTEDSTLTGSVAVNDSDVDDTALTYSLDAPVAGLTLNANGTYTFNAGASAYQGLAAGATLVVVANYTVTDPDGETSTSTLSITVTGTNEGPVAVADTATVSEDATVTGSVAANDSDLNGDALTYSLNAPVAGLTLNANGGYTFNAGNAAYQSLGHGESQVVVANYTVTDPFGATSTSTLSITVNGANDGPVVSGTATGNAVEGQLGVVATGDLNAIDADGDAVQWTVQGGNVPTNANYEFHIDQFTITGSSGLSFVDDFNNDVPPPDGATYSIFPGPAAGRFTEADGVAIMDSDNAGAITGIATNTPFVGQVATVNMPASEAGLSSDEDFTVTGLFDATLPDELREGYGIRLSDSSGPGTGNDVIELMVVRGSNGDVSVQLRSLDQSTSGFELVASVPLVDIEDDGAQIRLRLEYDAEGILIAEYDIVVDECVVKTVQVAEVSSTGLLFTGENWTRAGFFAFAPNPTVSYHEGVYGTLSIDSSGEWVYALDNHSDATQQLDGDDLVTDTFTVLANDGNGGVTSQVVTINVQGSNDAPELELGVESVEYPAYFPGYQTLIAPDAEMTDVDSENFDGGTLTVSFDDTFRDGDILAISGNSSSAGVQVDGNNVKFEGTLIGTWSGGADGDDLVILFNADATADIVQEVIQAIYYTSDEAEPESGPRVVTYTLADGDGTAFGGDDTGTDSVAIDVGGPAEPFDRIVVWDSSNDVDVFEAAEAIGALYGIDVVYAGNSSEFDALLFEDMTDLVIYSQPADWSGLQDIVDHLPTIDALIFSFWDLDQYPTLQSALNVSVAADFFAPKSIEFSGAFGLNGTFSPQSDDWNDNGDVLNAINGSEVIAQFVGGGNASIQSADGNIIVNGFLYDDINNVSSILEAQITALIEQSGQAAIIT